MAIRSRVLAAGLIAALAGPAVAGVAVGDDAPEFRGKTYAEEKAIELKALRGRVVLLEIFQTW